MLQLRRRITILLTLFFFNDTATTEIYTLSLHDALPIFLVLDAEGGADGAPALGEFAVGDDQGPLAGDRKSTRLNSSHSQTSHAVFCLKKKKCHEQRQDLDEHTQTQTDSRELRQA